VSRHHAELRRDTDGSYLLVDLGSTNGTMVNGERTATAHLRDGDRVGVGAATLTYRARAGLG
jgi:pSer/pThr/pTyr-binding forkhead associated (FHA) protein